MEESSLSREPNAAGNKDDVDTPGFLRRHASYLLVLALALAGVGYTNVTQSPLVRYWEFMALLMGVVCILAAWDDQTDRRARIRLIWTQSAHWIAVLVTMNIMALTGVRQLLPAPAAGLVLLMLLSLGSFLAGISLMSIQLCFVGLVMALAVPAISWFQQTMLIFIIGAVFLIGLALAFLPIRAKG